MRDDGHQDLFTLKQSDDRYAKTKTLDEFTAEPGSE
jgi:hypothetical protein